MKSQGITKVIMIHPLETMNVGANPVWTKVVDQWPTLPSPEPRLKLRATQQYHQSYYKDFYLLYNYSSKNEVLHIFTT